MPDQRLLCDRFPRSAKYHPDWMLEGAFGGPVIWLTEWLAESMNLQPGMRVLDLGCGRAKSSVFLAREFGVEVWAVDLWVSASENAKRLADLEMGKQILPFHADARSLPFAGETFDAILSVDAFGYFGTDALYLNYLANFVKPGGQIGIAGAGLVKKFEPAGDSNPVPEHLRKFWTQDCWSLHSPDWWKEHWQRTGIVDVELADRMPDGWRVWLDWQNTLCPDNTAEIEAINADAGRYLGYGRVIASRRPGVELEKYCWPDPLRSLTMIEGYEPKPLLRE